MIKGIIKAIVSEDSRVVVTIEGKVLTRDYLRMLKTITNEFRLYKKNHNLRERKDTENAGIRKEKERTVS